MRHVNIAGRDRNLHGWRPDPPDHRDKVFRAPSIAAPPVVDLRSRCPPLRDQYGWASCTANACAEALGFLYTQNAKSDPLFSRFFIYYFTRKFSADDPTLDDGSSIRDAIKVLAKKGACLESSWPYEPENFGIEPTLESQIEALDHQTILYYRCTSLRTVQASIAQGYPVIFGFSIPEGMSSEETTNTGIIKFPKIGEGLIGGHAILACGYDDNKQQITFQNSWGEWWGDKGFGYLPYQFFTEHLVADFWTIRRVEA